MQGGKRHQSPDGGGGKIIQTKQRYMKSLFSIDSNDSFIVSVTFFFLQFSQYNLKWFLESFAFSRSQKRSDRAVTSIGTVDQVFFFIYISQIITKSIPCNPILNYSCCLKCSDELKQNALLSFCAFLKSDNNTVFLDSALSDWQTKTDERRNDRQQHSIQSFSCTARPIRHAVATRQDQEPDALSHHQSGPDPPLASDPRTHLHRRRDRRAYQWTSGVHRLAWSLPRSHTRPRACYQGLCFRAGGGRRSAQRKWCGFSLYRDGQCCVVIRFAKTHAVWLAFSCHGYGI